MGADAHSIWKEIWTNFTQPQFEKAMSGNPTWNLDQFIPISRDGQIVEAYFTYGYSPLFIEDGTINGVLTTAVETTASVVNSDKLKLALNVTKMGFFDWDMVKDHVTFNDQMKADWGIEAGTQIKSVLDFIHPDDVPMVSEEIEKAISEMREYNFTYRVINPKNGIVWIEAKGHAKYENGTPVRFLGTSLNVTERHQSKMALEEALYARDEFLSIASHELKTPLTTLKLHAQSLLRRKVETDPAVLKLIKQTDLQVSRLNRLVDDMLDVSYSDRKT